MIISDAQLMQNEVSITSKSMNMLERKSSLLGNGNNKGKGKHKIRKRGT